MNITHSVKDLSDLNSVIATGRVLSTQSRLENSDIRPVHQ